MLTGDQRLFRETTKDFLAKEMPLTKVREAARSSAGFDRVWWRRGAELGWTSMLAGPDLGGGSISEEGLLDAALVAGEMGRMVSPGPLLAVNVVVSALSEAADAGRHAEVVTALMAGDAVAAWAIYEPGAGWGPADIAVRADRSGGGLVLNGVKDRVESGDQADYFLVTARSDDGLRQLLVPADTPGIGVTRMESLDPVRRFAEVRFDEVRLPASAMVEPAPVHSSVDATGAVERQLDVAVALQCAEMVGAVGRVLEFTVQWASDRYTFGRPLASYQALKHRFADMKTWFEAARGIADAAASAVQHRRAEAAELASVAKSYIGQRATDIVQDCVQLHGGIGVTWEHDIHLYLRRVTVDRATWGTPAEHRARLADILKV